MVKFWDIHLDLAIVRTKRRIKLCEALGMGDTAMREKQNLKKQERKKELRLNK